MTTETERAIAKRETRSRNAAKKRGIGKYADEAFQLDEYLDDEDAEAEAADTGKTTKAKKS